MYAMKVNHYIKYWREARGFTQDELAQRASVSRTSINRIEAGKQKPALDISGSIADALGITLDELRHGPEATKEVLAENRAAASESDTLGRIVRRLCGMEESQLLQVLGYTEALSAGDKSVSASENKRTA